MKLTHFMPWVCVFGMTLSGCDVKEQERFVVTAKDYDVLVLEDLDSLRTQRVMEFDYNTDAYNSRMYYHCIRVGDTICLAQKPGCREFVLKNIYFSRFGNMQRISRVNGGAATTVLRGRLRAHQRDSIANVIRSTQHTR